MTCDVAVAMDDASAEDVVVDNVAQLSGQAEKNAMSLCIHDGCGVVRWRVGVACLGV